MGSAINSDSNADVCIIVEVDSVGIFIIDNSLIFSTNSKGEKLKRKQRMNNVFKEKFRYPPESNICKEDCPLVSFLLQYTIDNCFHSTRSKSACSLFSAVQAPPRIA